MLLAQTVEPDGAEPVPLEAVAMVAVSEARTAGELADGISLYSAAMKTKFHRLREIGRELNG